MKVEWSPYHRRGSRSRVLGYVMHCDGIELELISEGGQWVVRRTTWEDFRVVRQEETARGIPRVAKETWYWLTGRKR